MRIAPSFRRGAQALRHLVERDQAEVGEAEHRRRLPVAGQVDRLEARLLDQQRRERVVGAGRGDDPPALQQRLERQAATVALIHGPFSPAYAVRLRATPYSATAAMMTVPWITICQ